MIRHSLTAAVALACLAAAYPVGGPEARTNQQRLTTLKVLICVGDPARKPNCGPREKAKVSGRGPLRRGARGSFRYSWGDANAQNAGTVSAQRPKIDCGPEPKCSAPVASGQRITLTQRENASVGRHEFHHWEAECEGPGPDDRSTCPIRVRAGEQIVRVYAVYGQKGR